MVYCGEEVDEISNELMCPVEMFKDYDYAFHGHIHTPQVMNRNPHIAHIGSLDISNFGETNRSKF